MVYIVFSPKKFLVLFRNHGLKNRSFRFLCDFLEVFWLLVGSTFPNLRFPEDNLQSKLLQVRFVENTKTEKT